MFPNKIFLDLGQAWRISGCALFWSGISLFAWSWHFSYNDSGLSYRDAILILSGSLGILIQFPLWSMRKRL